MITTITPIILKCLILLIMDFVFICLHYKKIYKIFSQSNILRIIRLNIAYLRTKNINISNMFNSCSLPENFDTNRFNTDNITNASNMFCDYNSLTNIDMSEFNTDKVTDISTMFDGCSLENLDLNSYFSK